MEQYEHNRILHLICKTANIDTETHEKSLLSSLQSDFITKVSHQLSSLIVKSLNEDNRTISTNYLSYLQLLVRKPERHFAVHSSNLEVFLDTIPLTRDKQIGLKYNSKDLAPNISSEKCIIDFYKEKEEKLKARKEKLDYIRQTVMDKGSDFKHSTNKPVPHYEFPFSEINDQKIKSFEEKLSVIKLSYSLLNLEYEFQSAENVIHNVLLGLMSKNENLEDFEVEFVTAFYKKLVMKNIFENLVESHDDFIEHFSFVIEEPLVTMATDLVKENSSMYGVENVNEDFNEFVMKVMGKSPLIKLKVVNICLELFLLSGNHPKLTPLLNLINI